MIRPTLLMSALVVMALATPSYAELIAYEGFDYADVGGELFGKTGGTGFTGKWMPISNTTGWNDSRSYEVAEGSLSFDGISTTGNRIRTDDSFFWALLGRTLADPVPADDTRTMYLSFLVRPEKRAIRWSSVGLVGGNSQRLNLNTITTASIGAAKDGVYGIANFGGSLNHPTDVLWSEGETALLVVKAELMTGIDTLTLYANPIPGLPEPATGTVKQDMDLEDLTAFAVFSNGAHSIDELRWGDTFNDVVPAPPQVEFIGSSEPWSVFPGTVEPSTFPELGWTTPGFNDSQWTSQQEGIGYDRDTGTRGIVTVLSDMKDRYETVYLRHSFEAENPEFISDLVLQLDYDDAFIAYINGVEVVRSKVGTPGTAEPFDPSSIRSRSGSGVNNFHIELASFPKLLQPGDGNVLAIQGINARSSDQDFVLSQIQLLGLEHATKPSLQAGDADQDFDFDQLDLVRVQVAAKYLTGEPATWGEGDWNGAPGGVPGNPPQGDGVFNQLDIVAAQQAAVYLTGPYAGVQSQTTAAVPEPSGLLLLWMGLLALACRRYRVRMGRECSLCAARATHIGASFNDSTTSVVCRQPCDIGCAGVA